MTPARRLLLPTVALTAACCLAACSGGSSATSSSSTASSTSSTAGSTSPPSGPTTTTSTSASSGSAPSGSASSGSASSGTPTSPTGGPAACTSADVTLSAGSAGASAGHVLYNLVATARSGHSCTLFGYPGVSLVAGRGAPPIGHPAIRVRVTAHRVTLRAGQSASAPVQVAQAADYGSRCSQKQAAGFGVYLPDQKDQMFAPAKATGCTESSIDLLQVKPFAR